MGSVRVESVKEAVAEAPVKQNSVTNSTKVTVTPVGPEVVDGRHADADGRLGGVRAGRVRWAVGGVDAILVIAAVVGAFATRYAVAAGETRQAGIFGFFGGFWLSYSALILGLTHNWYGIDPEQTAGALAIFLGSWLVVGLGMTVASLGLPAAFTALFGLFDLALVLLLRGALVESIGLYTAAGITIALFSALATYLYLVSAAPAAIGGKLPLGKALVSEG
jgi:succinate-acetate transporter protein